MEMAIEDRDLLEEYFLERFPEKVMDEEVYHLLLLVMGLKPGVLVMSAGRPQIQLLEDFCEDLGLEMMVVQGGKRSFLDRLLGRDSRFRKDSIYIAKKEDRFEILEQSEGDFTCFSDEAVGRFLGYPDEALQFYSEEEIPAREFQEFAYRKMEESEISEEDLGYLELLGYLPKPDKANFKEAIEEAKRREKNLKELDEELGCLIGKSYLQRIKT